MIFKNKRHKRDGWKGGLISCSAINPVMSVWITLNNENAFINIAFANWVQWSVILTITIFKHFAAVIKSNN